MNILLVPVGSHGDVHPLVGVGRALKSRGHRVSLITSAPFRDLAAKNGFDEFVPIGTDADYDALADDPDLWSPLRSLRVVFDPDRTARFMRETYRHITARYVPGETVVVAGSLSLAARLAHETLGVPFASVNLQPISFLSVADPPVFPTQKMYPWWPLWLRRFVYWAADLASLDPLLAGPVNGFRQELGLHPVRRIFTKWLPSPQRVIGLFPEWFGPARDLPRHARLTGFVRYDQSSAARVGEGEGRRGGEKSGEGVVSPSPPLPLSHSRAVEDFLNAGEPPVVITFGSAMRTGRAYFAAAAEACRRLGVRGLLLGKKTGQIPDPLPPGVAHAEYAPFSLVFPRAAAVVHHGGVGTTAQALAAGVPQLVMPLAFDQHDNAARLVRLGVARVLRPTWFRPAAVADALKKVLADPAVPPACREYAAKLAADDPLPETVRLIEELVGKDRHPS